MNHSHLHRLAFEWRRIRKMPLTTLVGKALTKLLGLILGLMLLPLTALLHLAGYRHVTIFTDRIGHLALEPDCLLKKQALGLIASRKWIILAPPNRIANEHLLYYWQPHFRIVRNRYACFVITSMSWWGLMRHDITHYVRAIGKTQAAYRIYAEWGNRLPLLKLSAEDEIWGREKLKELGIPEDAWFVCVHAREAGFSPIDEELHAHRNSSIENTFAAMSEIVRRGGWVVRIGDGTMKKIPSMPNIIDYAHHALRSPRLDVYLCARARFILASTSGIALVGTVFGTPCALTNMIPLAAMGISPQDISIPKLHWFQCEKRYLGFAEILNSPISRAQYCQDYADAGIHVEENSPEEIEELVIEMLDRLEGKFLDDPECKMMQKMFFGLLVADHYSFGTTSTIGSQFLKRHKTLQCPENSCMLAKNN